MESLVEVPIYFEDLVIGGSFVTDEVTVDDEEMLTYNRRNNPWPFHVDEVSAAQNPYGSLIASGGYTITLMYRLAHRIYNVPGRRWAVLGALDWRLSFLPLSDPAITFGCGSRSRANVRRAGPSVGISTFSMNSSIRRAGSSCRCSWPA